MPEGGEWESATVRLLTRARQVDRSLAAISHHKSKSIAPRAWKCLVAMAGLRVPWLGDPVPFVHFQTLGHTFSALETYIFSPQNIFSALGTYIFSPWNTFVWEMQLFQNQKKFNKQRRRVAKAVGNATKSRDYLETVWELEVKGWEKESVEDKQGAKIEAAGGGGPRVEVLSSQQR